MKNLFLSLLILFSAVSVHATSECTDVRLSAIKSLTTCDSKTEVIIYNSDYCISNISGMSLTDSENFTLDTNYGSVPCGDISLQTRGYEFCTVGIEFTPVTSSGTFSTDFQVSNAVDTYTIESITGNIKSCCSKPKCNSKKYCKNGKHNYGKKHCKNTKYKYGEKYCKNGKHNYGKKHCKSTKYKYGEKYCKNGKHNYGKKHCKKACGESTTQTNYLAGLNLVTPTDSTSVYVENNTLVFNEYNSNAAEGRAVIQLDEVASSSTIMTFDANLTEGLFMPVMYSDSDRFMTTDVRHAKRYGFIFPESALDELHFFTWNVSTTGTVSNISLVDYVNPDLLP